MNDGNTNGGSSSLLDSTSTPLYSKKIIRIAATNGSILTRPCAFDWPPPDAGNSAADGDDLAATFCPMPGIVPELTRIILSILLPNVTVQFVPAKGYGFDLDKLDQDQNQNNSTTMTEEDKNTILGLIETGQADLTAGDLTLTSERAGHYAHLSAILPYRMAFILRREEASEPSLSFQNLFKWEVYLLIGSFILCYQVYRHIVQRLSVGSASTAEWSRKMLIRQAVFLGIFAAVLFRLFSAEIVLIFNKPMYITSVSTTMEILDAMQNGDLTGVTGYKIYWDQVLHPAAYRNLSPIFDRFMAIHERRYNGNRPMFLPNETAAVQRISEGLTRADRRLVVLTEELTAEIFLSTYCNLRIVVDDFFSNKYYTIYAKSSATLAAWDLGSGEGGSAASSASIRSGLVTLIKADFYRAKRSYIRRNNLCNDPLLSTPVQESITAFEAILPHPLKFGQLKLIFQIFAGFNGFAACFFTLELCTRLCKLVKCLWSWWYPSKKQ